MTKRFLTILAFAAMVTSPALAADTYVLDQNHVNVVWHANHFGFSNPSGRFGIVDGTVTLDEAAPEKSNVEVTINVGGLATGIDKFDAHLKSADFLDVEKYPHAIFKSTSVELTGKDSAKVSGNLVLHGVSKPVVLDVKLNKLDMHPMVKKKTAGFTAHTIIKRSDFGIDQHIPAVSDEVTINIEAEANLKD